MSDRTTIRLNLPLADADVLALYTGDAVLLSGVLLTGRDAAHKWLTDTFINHTTPATRPDSDIYEKLQPVLKNGAIYHCGPVVSKREDSSYVFTAAGPTTSIREEPYQADVIHHFGIKAVIGKGGMGEHTLLACQKEPAVYLHATGGAAAVTAACIKEVLGVYKLEFGVPEAMWLIRVEDLPLVVSMDAHGCSLHEKIRAQSRRIYEELVE